MRRLVFLIYSIFLCSALGWGQTWELTPTMSAQMSNGWLTISSTAASESIPNFTREKPGPWKSLRSNFGLRIVGNIISIGNYAFADCEYLTTISFVKTRVEGKNYWESSNNLTSIGEGAFGGCVNLGIGDGFRFPDTLTSIGNYAFRGCTSFKNFRLTSSLTSIGEGAFQDCTGLRWIDVEWKTPLQIPDNVFASLNTADISLYVPKGTTSRYNSADVWKNFNVKEDIGSTSTSFKPIIGERPLAWIILILSVILFFMRIIKDKDETRRGTSYIVSNTLFLTVCALEIIFIISTIDSGMPWFCDPNEVGWLWTIINFFLLGGVVISQILYMFDVFIDVFTNGNAGCDLRLGYFSWIGGFICALLCSWFFEEGLTWVFVVVGIMQVIQSVLIFRSYGNNIKGAFWGVLVYLLGICGTVAVLYVFIVMLIIVLLGIAVLWLVMKLTGVGESSSGKSGRIHYSDGSSEEATGEKGALGETYWTGKKSGNTHTTSF